jgi:hypothetical protein
LFAEAWQENGELRVLFVKILPVFLDGVFL